MSDIVQALASVAFFTAFMIWLIFVTQRPRTKVRDRMRPVKRRKK